MESTNKTIKNKGGRPRKAIKKDQLLGVKCTLLDRNKILVNANQANLSVSEYLLQMGLTGKIDTKHRALPPDVLELMGLLHYNRGLLNQIAKKRNGFDDLSSIDRSNLKIQADTFDQWAQKIENFFK